MWVNRAFRFELDPNSSQRQAILQHIGAARFAFNWGLEIVKKSLERKEKIPSAPELHKMWNTWKKDNAPWWKEVSKCAPQEAFRDLEKGIKRWKAKQARLPKFKKKKLIPDNSVRFTGSIRVFTNYVQIPRIGRVRSKEPTEKLLRLLEEGKAKILSAVISQEADRFYVSITCMVKRQESKVKEVKSEDDIVGVDLGLSSFAVLSDGTKVDAPKPLARKLKLLKRRSTQFSRKQKGSNNSKKAALKLARFHRKIKNTRQDFLHKLSTWLARTKPVIVVEDLNVRGLSRGWLSRSIYDSGWGTFRRMLEYKTKWYGSTLIVVPKSFPSTRLCSQCGHLHGKIPLSQRVFRCENCGLEMDRDLNAAINLKKYGLTHLMGSTASSAGSNACGDPSGGGTGLWTDSPWTRSTSYGSMKQEVASYHCPLEEQMIMGYGTEACKGEEAMRRASHGLSFQEEAGLSGACFFCTITA